MFGSNIAFLRKQKNLKQDEMPELTGISRATWSDYERGHTEPDFATLLKIADIFGIDVDTLLKEDIPALSAMGKLTFYEDEPQKTKKGKPISKGIGKLKKQNDLNKEVFSAAKGTGENISFTPKVITIDTTGNENIVMVPVKARAGYLTGYGDPDFISTLPAYRLPGLNNGHYRIFEVQGLSMHPVLFDKDLVICQYVEQLRLVRDDRIHVIITKNEGIVIKTVLNRLEKDGKLILKSENYKDKELYPNIVIEPQDVMEIWYCIAFISNSFRRSTEQYNRLIDIEGRIVLLEQAIKKNKP